jgi:LPS O-antigen subunit length determinant protein (WzzB/FepE family)
MKRKGMFRVNKNQNSKVQKAASAHRDSLQKSLEHRLEVARANGDEDLIRQLEQEASYLRLN